MYVCMYAPALRRQQQTTIGSTLPPHINTDLTHVLIMCLFDVCDFAVGCEC